MPSETDPLLPRGNTAPEITGHGFSRPSQSQSQSQNQYQYQYQSQNQNQNQTQDELLDYPEYIENKSEQKARASYGDISPLRTIFVIFVLVVGLAMFVSLLMPGAFEIPWNSSKAPKDGALTVKARVDKILAETPLIGPPALLIRHLVGMSSDSRVRWA